MSLDTTLLQRYRLLILDMFRKRAMGWTVPKPQFLTRLMLVWKCLLLDSFVQIFQVFASLLVRRRRRSVCIAVLVLDGQ
jgi:hypothetical protein